MSNDWRATLQAAFDADASGRFTQAEELCGRVLAAHPANIHALLLRAVVTAKIGRESEAIDRLREVLAADPSNPIAMNWLSMLLRGSGRNEEALSLSERAVRVVEDDPDIRFNLGLSYLEASRVHEAVDAIQIACDKRPDYPPYLYGLANSLEACGRNWEAVRAFRAANRLAPSSGALERLANLLLVENRPEEALEAARSSIELDPRSPTAHLMVSEALITLGDEAGAAGLYQTAIRLDPSLARTQIVRKVNRLTRLGRLEEAAALYKEAIATTPADGHVYYGALTSKKMTEADRPFLASVEAVLLDDRLSDPDRVPIHYGLGKAWDELEKYELAMRHFEQANATILESRPPSQRLDREAFARRVDAEISLFTPRFVEGTKLAGSPSEAPIFIVGMMRSGTTLVDQILSCHPDVGSAGEQGFWSFNESKIVDLEARSIDSSKLRRYSSEYLEILGELAPGKPRVTDKNPANVMVLGLVHCAFPNARIIHMRRHPVDTCLSIYMTSVKVPPDFANDRSNIVFAYREYQRLADHWRTVIPADRLLEVQYEELVQEQEPQTRRILEFCGLEWDAACLAPEKSSSKVETPSFWQVRRPLYRTSLERWRRYEPWLGAFRELLDDNQSTAKQNEKRS